MAKGLSIDIRFDNERHIKGIWGIAIKAMDNLKPIMDDIHKEYLKNLSDNFKNEVQKTGKWPRLKEAYRIWKIKNGYGNKKLVLTGRMKAAATKENDRDHVYKTNKNSMLIGMYSSYADYHLHRHKSYRRPPKRDFAYISNKKFDAYRQLIAKSIKTHLNNKTKQQIII